MREFAAVLVGGVIGSGLRLAIDGAFSRGDDVMPWSTLVINTVGSFILAVLAARFWDAAPTWLRAGLGTGLLGSFTTFSALTVGLITLASTDWIIAACYLVSTLILGLSAAWFGFRIGRPRCAADAAGR